MYLATKPSYRRTVAATHPWKALITSRRSSGSSCAASTVESTRSQNITVSWRRSAPAMASLDVRLGVNVLRSGTGSASANAAPQLPQYLLPGGVSAPHAAQEGGSDAPQSPQNLLPAAFEVPQLGQSMYRLQPECQQRNPIPTRSRLGRATAPPVAHRSRRRGSFMALPSEGNCRQTTRRHHHARLTSRKAARLKSI